MDQREYQLQYSAQSFDFGIAIRLMRVGLRVARQGWTGGRYVVYQPGSPDGVPIEPVLSEAVMIAEGVVCIFKPYFLEKTSDFETTFQTWSPTSDDALAEDWQLYDDPA